MSTKNETKRYSRDMEVFESIGATENTMNYDDDSKSMVVEMLDSNLKSSFGKFKGKQMSSRYTDFSDNVCRPIYYQVDPEEYEVTGDIKTHQSETLMQRYHRLKLEVTQLMTDVDQLKESKDDLGQISPGDLVTDLQKLQRQLHQVELEKTLTNSPLVGGDTQEIVFKELQTELAAVKSQPPPPPSSSSSDKAVYEVYANLESAKFGHLSKLSEIEGRITVLENLVGKSDPKGSLIAAGLDAEYRDLSGAVLALQAKVTLLDEAYVGNVISQLKVLLENLKEFQTKTKELDTDPEQKTKVAEALQTMSQVTPLITLIPDLVDRLHSLKDLHEHAAMLSSTVSTLSEGQDSLNTQLGTCTSLLEQVQKSVGSNMETIQTNFTNLKSRIDKVQV